MTSALAGVACGGGGFNGCEASRTCVAQAGSGSSGAPTAGYGGEGAAGKAGQGGASAGGSSGSADKGGSGGKTPSSMDDAGAGNVHEATGSGGGGTHDGESAAGAGDEKPPPPAGSGGGTDVADDGGAGMGGAETEPPRDTTAPTVVMVTTERTMTPWPDTGGTGVEQGDVIVVVFSEPMDTEKTEGAYASDANDLPATVVKFSWDDTKTRLAIQPQEALQYTEVNDPAEPGQKHSFVIGTGAEDTSGNALAASRTVVFTMMRHLVHSLSVELGGGAVVTQPTTGKNDVSIRCQVAHDHLSAGDDEDDDAVFALAMFDLTPLPDAIYQWGSATLTASLDTTLTNPYGSDTGHLGQVHAFATSVAPTTAVWESATNDIGLFGKYASQTDASLDVTATVKSDYQNRKPQQNLSEYLFRFDRQTNGDGTAEYAYIYCDDLKLNLDYVAP
ncbi:MAG TPA: Ig-like domain-containing protein [Polyangiaceae bacterium]|nr:Ig-like domain-containing protein [Polyangiaceae bacterium]